MKAFVYCRKSREKEDRQVLSIESQLIEAQGILKRNGLEVVDVFQEKKSAKAPGRPVYNEMIRRIKKGEVHALVCWKLDRLSRNSVDSGDICWLLETGKVQRIFTYEKVYENNTNDKFMMGMDFVLSKRYVDDLSTNVKRGLRTAMEKGKWVGSSPIGYRWANGALIVDPEKAPLVKKAFTLYATGNHTNESVAEFLRKHGVKRAKSKVHTMLRNKIYVGVMEFGDIVTQGVHEPLVTKRVFDRVQELLGANRSGAKLKTKHDYVFRGILTCAECECSMTAERQKGHVYYRCTRQKKKDCKQPYIREEALAKEVSALVSSFAFPLETLSEGMGFIKEETKELMQSRKNMISGIKNRIVNLELKRSKLVDAFLSEKIDEETYRSEKKRIDSQIAFAHSEQNEIAQESDEYIDKALPMFELLKTLFSSLNTFPPDKVAGFSKLLYSNLTIQDRKISSYLLNPPFDLLVKDDLVPSGLGWLGRRDEIRSKFLLGLASGQTELAIRKLSEGHTSVKEVLAISNLTC